MRWRALLPPFLASVILALSVMQCHGWDGTVNGDGVSYLDLAARYANGDLAAVANGYWSPLYPMLLGGALRLAGLDGAAAASSSEMRVVFVSNVLVLASAALAFGRLLLVLVRASMPRSTGVLACRLLAAAALLAWCAIRMVAATSVTPDALLSTWLFLVTADLVEAAIAPPSARATIRFSIVLGAAYWTKAVSFPVAPVAAAAYLLLSLRWVAGARARRVHLVRVVVPALVLIVPLVAVQSVSQRRLSFGETGALNYRWYVSGAPHAPPRIETEARTRTDPSPRVVALTGAPGTVLFHGDVPGSFPYWSDPSRFETHEPLAFSLGAQWRRVAYNAHWFRVVGGTFLLFAMIAFAASLVRRRPSPTFLAPAVPAFAMMTLYALTHVEGRLAAAPIVVVLTMFLLPMSRPVGGEPSRTAGASLPPVVERASVVVECAALVALAVVALGRTAKRVPLGTAHERAAVLVPALRASGMAPGSALGIVGAPYGHYWAHQARVRLVVVTDVNGRSEPVGEEELATIARESCSRGTALAGIVGERREDVSAARAIALDSRWWLWRPSAPCGGAPSPQLP
jgi:hypothetical protein